eukprot:tig00001024_g6332.t2
MEPEAVAAPPEVSQSRRSSIAEEAVEEEAASQQDVPTASAAAQPEDAADEFESTVAREVARSSPRSQLQLLRDVEHYAYTLGIEEACEIQRAKVLNQRWNILVQKSEAAP